MSSYESFADGGIIVARQAIDPEVVAGMVSDGNQLVDIGVPYEIKSGNDSPGPVESTVRRYARLQPQYDNIRTVADLVVGPRAPLCGIVINRQHPFSFQRFHPDRRKLPFAVVHGNDGGAFDYIESDVDDGEYFMADDGAGLVEYDPSDFETIELDAGDVLLQINTALVHRGRNLSSQDRITVGIYTE